MKKFLDTIRRAGYDYDPDLNRFVRAFEDAAHETFVYAYFDAHNMAWAVGTFDGTRLNDAMQPEGLGDTASGFETREEAVYFARACAVPHVSRFPCIASLPRGCGAPVSSACA